ncbi:MAG: hypothetical protein JNN30_15905 [Rhodanobacteraceae bacterium]|nr:hypothetical protein [Rhodanobacteraceae bacterium]
MLRLGRGQTVPQSSWRVAEIRPTQATFTRLLPDRSDAFSISITRGASIDFSALDQHLLHATDPLPLSETQVLVNPARGRR